MRGVKKLEDEVERIKSSFGPSGSFQFLTSLTTIDPFVAKSSDLLIKFHLQKYEYEPTVKQFLQSILNLKRIYFDGGKRAFLLTLELLKRLIPYLHPTHCINEAQIEDLDIQHNSFAVSAIKLSHILQDVLSFINTKVLNFPCQIFNLQDDQQFLSILRSCLNSYDEEKLSFYTNLIHKLFIEQKITRDIEIIENNQITNPTANSFISFIGISGENYHQTFVINGLLFEKTFDYAGSASQPKRVQNPKILLIDFELEYKRQSEISKIEVKDINELMPMIEQESKLFSILLENILKLSPSIVISSKSIGDIAVQFFARNSITSFGRVPLNSMQMLSNVFSTPVHSNIDFSNVEIEINRFPLGICSFFEEKQIGDKFYEVFHVCEGEVQTTKVSTIIVREISQVALEESIMSITNAIMYIHKLEFSKKKKLVVGCGAFESYLTAYIRHHANCSPELSAIEQKILREYADSVSTLNFSLVQNIGVNPLQYVIDLENHYEQQVQNLATEECDQNNLIKKEFQWSGLKMNDMFEIEACGYLENYCLESVSAKVGLFYFFCRQER